MASKFKSLNFLKKQKSEIQNDVCVTTMKQDWILERRRNLSIPDKIFAEHGKVVSNNSKLYTTMENYVKGSGQVGDQSLLPLDAKEIFRMKVTWQAVQRKITYAGTELVFK